MLYQCSKACMKRNMRPSSLNLRKLSYATTTKFNYSNNTNSSNSNQILSPPLLLSGLIVATGLVATLPECNRSNGMIRLDDVNNESISANVKESPDDTVEEEDDYSDLPEEDEPTSCSICLINRQGPCRNPWRRFEKCIKDNPDNDDNDNDNNNKSDDDDDDDILSSTSSSTLLDKCSKVSFIWFNCLDKHRVTYTMITNKQYQPELEAMEEKYKDNKYEFSTSPTIDISHYQEYQLAMYEKQQEEGEDVFEDENEEQHDPSKPENFVSGYVYFNLYLNNNDDSSDIKEIDVAYVKDQNGDILGFDHFTHDKKDNENNDTDKSKAKGELIFHIPVNTTSLTACALYKSNKKKSNDEDNRLEKKDKDEKGDDNVDDDDGIFYYHTISNLIPKKETDDS